MLRKVFQILAIQIAFSLLLTRLSVAWVLFVALIFRHRAYASRMTSVMIQIFRCDHQAAASISGGDRL